MMKDDHQINDAEILKEIFLPPSEKIVTDRFSQPHKNDASQCSGKCDSGVCITFV